MIENEFLTAYLNESIPRLIKQCKGGDEAFSFLSVYSFIEGFLRRKYRTAMKDNVGFPSLIDLVKKEQKKGESSEVERFYEELKRFHGNNNIRASAELITNVSTNDIRHCFGKMDEQALPIVLDHFFKFAKYNSFFDFEGISSFFDWCRQKFKDNFSYSVGEEPKDFYPFFEKSDLLISYHDLKYSAYSEIEEINTILKESTSFDDVTTAFKRKQLLFSEIENLTSQIGKSDIEYYERLYKSLLNAQSSKYYESRIISLSKEQLSLINNDIYKKITQEEGCRSMYIKGGPGTGKTLILLASVLKLVADSRGSYKLLTFYPTLNKYISYMFGLLNDSNLMEKNLGYNKIERASLEKLKADGIRRFDEFMIPRVIEALKFHQLISQDVDEKKTVSIEDWKDQIINAICKESEKKELVSEIYRDIVEFILPNGINAEEYCSQDPSNVTKWSIIQKVFVGFDQQKVMFDSYLYYLFYVNSIKRDFFASTSLEYILVDEAQDLTNAQLYAVNTMVSKSGALILAGDPSQEIRNPAISMPELGISLAPDSKISSSVLRRNFRSTVQIQNLGNLYKEMDCLDIGYETESVDSVLSGPEPQICITDDTEDTHFSKMYSSVASSVMLCINALDILPGNITVVSFSEKELVELTSYLEDKGIESVITHKSESFSFSNPSLQQDKVKLCTLQNIKGIDCPVVIFMIGDQNALNSSGIQSSLRSSAIYTCITRAMFLLQVFIPKYCIMEDLSISALISLKTTDSELRDYIDEQNNRVNRGIPIGYIFKKKNKEKFPSYLKRVETNLKKSIDYLSKRDIEFRYSSDKKFVRVYEKLLVVEDVKDGLHEISIEDAAGIKSDSRIGDVISVYIDPNDLSDDISKLRDNSENLQERIESEIKLEEQFAHELFERYEQLKTQTLDERMQEYMPNGYLNVAGMGLKKPHEYGYNFVKWPELIMSREDLFEWIKVPYSNGSPGYVFAFRPAPKDNAQIVGKKEKVFSSPYKKKFHQINEAYKDILAIYDSNKDSRIGIHGEKEGDENDQYILLARMSHSVYRATDFGYKKWSEIIETNPFLFELISFVNKQGMKELAYRVKRIEGTIENENKIKKYYEISYGNSEKVKAFFDKNPNYLNLDVGDRIEFDVKYEEVQGKVLPSAINMTKMVLSF